MLAILKLKTVKAMSCNYAISNSIILSQDIVDRFVTVSKEVIDNNIYFKISLFARSKSSLFTFWVNFDFLYPTHALQFIVYSLA